MQVLEGPQIDAYFCWGISIRDFQTASLLFHSLKITTSENTLSNQLHIMFIYFVSTYYPSAMCLALYNNSLKLSHLVLAVAFEVCTVIPLHGSENWGSQRLTNKSHLIHEVSEVHSNLCLSPSEAASLSFYTGPRYPLNTINITKTSSKAGDKTWHIDTFKTVPPSFFPFPIMAILSFQVLGPESLGHWLHFHSYPKSKLLANLIVSMSII